MAYTVTVKVELGSPLTLTLPGHVWYEISDGTNVYSYGLYPESRVDLVLNGVVSPIEGSVHTDDSLVHQDFDAGKVYQITQG